MTWKSYAAVSGVTVLAGWLASSPAPSVPASVSTRAAAGPRASVSAASDIAQQADRLQARLPIARRFAEPRRDPFRFAERRTAADRVAPRIPIPEAPTPPVDTNPAPQVSLSGIAEEQVNGAPARTAVLSSPAGVLLVREGDEVLGYYRVAHIESEAVDLVGLDNGVATRLTFAGH
jgi:hypothetical protein